jgi:signal transduction histidine kinase
MQLRNLFEIGVFEDTDPWDARYIRYSNMFSMMMMLANLVISTALYIAYGPSLMTVIIFSLMFLFGVILLLSSLRLYALSHFLLAIIVPVGVMAISYITKSQNPELVRSYAFFDTRTVLLGGLVVPIVLFPVKKKFFLIIGTLLPGIFILFYDPIHSLLGVGYNQLLGALDLGYRISGVYYAISYSFLVTGLLIFKFGNEKLVTKNIALVDGLQTSNKYLTEASDTIKEQSAALIESNIELSELVDQRTAELKTSNEELIKHNLELQQFSNTVSHNLRGPVANLLGLAHLFELDKDEKTKAELIKHIRSSAMSLDEVLKDLGKIIDIRNHLFQIKENVSFTEEFEKVRAMLSEQIKVSKAQITTKFDHDNLYCIRSYINSILYNLLSNAIKYKHTSRPLEIMVSSKLSAGDIIMEIEDNGIGIDLERYGDKIFGMYKRFHDHVEGKGLGLFLTRQQVENLGGKIEVESTPDIGTKYIMTYPKPQDKIISEQVFYESDAVIIWFDAINNISTLVWKRKPSSDEYRDGITKNLEIFRTYKCHGCLADVRKLGIVGKEDMTWFVNNILSDASEIGMQKFIIVHDSNDGKDDAYFEEMRKSVEAHNIYFDHDSFDMKEAKHIIRNTITN